jgi:hypothetical protein
MQLSLPTQADAMMMKYIIGLVTPQTATTLFDYSEDLMGDGRRVQ